MGKANGQFDDRLTRQDCRAIRRAIRKAKITYPKVLSAVLLDNGDVEAVAGHYFSTTGGACKTWLRMRRTVDGWEVAEELHSEHTL
jgi:hypothetical protein